MQSGKEMGQNFDVLEVSASFVYQTEEIMLYSYYMYYTLSPRQSQQLLWSRFVNIHGQQGRNVACDLYMEHLNRVRKEAIKGVGGNKTSETVQRVG